MSENLLFFLFCSMCVSSGIFLGYYIPFFFKLLKKKINSKEVPLKNRIEKLESEFYFLSEKFQDQQESLNKLFLSRGIKK